tara:strand:- start:915 stop:1931 length:1017 start_codon:yes stop_codon:yes gene_type:complete
MKPIAITMGDPAGISAEITIKTWVQRKEKKINPFFLIDHEKRVLSVAEQLKLNISTKIINSPKDAIGIFNEHLPIFNLKQPINSVLGRPNPKFVKDIIESIDLAINFAVKNEIIGIVTNPVSKEILMKKGFHQNGQTEYITEKINKIYKKKFKEIMILSTSSPDDSGTNLRVGLVTTHIPIKDVSKKLTKKIISQKIQTFHKSLVDLWKIKKPLIGICGLNPHCGENGMIGDEDKKLIFPVYKALKSKFNLKGLLSADTSFSKRNRKKFDGFICMFHDQGIIPVKTLDINKSVNITGGLPIIRTSPDHGPAFDIARLNLANHESLIASIKLIENFIKK